MNKVLRKLRRGKTNPPKTMPSDEDLKGVELEAEETTEIKCEEEGNQEGREADNEQEEVEEENVKDEINDEWITDNIELAENVLGGAIDIFLKDLNNSGGKMQRKKEELLNLCEQLIQIHGERARNKYTLGVLDEEISKTKQVIGHLTQIKQTEMEMRTKMNEPILYGEYSNISSTNAAKDFLSKLQEKQRNLDDLRKLAVIRMGRFSSERTKIVAKRMKDKSPLKCTPPKRGLAKESHKSANQSVQTATEEQPAISPREVIQFDLPTSFDIFEPRPPGPVPLVTVDTQPLNTTRNLSPTMYLRDPFAEALLSGLSLTDLDSLQAQSPTPNSLSTGISWSTVASVDSINLEIPGVTNTSQQLSTQPRSRSSLSINNGASPSQNETDV